MKFWHRIVLLVALAGAALLAVAAVTLILGTRTADQVTAIETRYVPLLELDRDLKSLFEPIPRTLRDAAAAAEQAGVVQSDGMRERLARAIDRGAVAIRDNGGDPAALVAELDAYYAIARDVTMALVGGTPAERVAAKIEAMKRAEDAFARHLEVATTPDRERLTAAFAAARASQRTTLVTDLVVAVVALLLMALVSARLVRRTIAALREVSAGMERLARREFDREIAVRSSDELGELAREANRTAAHLRAYRESADDEDWIKTGLGALGDEIAGELDARTLARRAMTFLARYTGAEVAVIYGSEPGDDGAFHLLDSFGAASAAPESFRLGETVTGQAARDDEVRIVEGDPAEHLTVRSALTKTVPRFAMIVPATHEDRAMAVLELGLLGRPSPRAQELVQRARGMLGIAFRVAESRHRAGALLDETQRQATELRDANATLVSARSELEDKAEQLARASRYKSEFLANMSHELRTPLNSVMILSKLLRDNAEKTLTDKQIEFAHLIHRSGEELLALINDVLDLAKVEAGKQVLAIEDVATAELADYARSMFAPIAAQKKLALDVVVGDGAPQVIRTDRTRLSQILKNLLSNAFKFTEHGSVSFAIDAAPDGMVALAVTDTGIGIPADKRAQIFEAFTQADGGTSRKYGGTGLGLTIARQLATRLGGALTVESEHGVGSTFRVVLPIAGPTSEVQPAIAEAAIADVPRTTKPHILVIEDDVAFAGVMRKLVEDEGVACVTARDGRTGLALAGRDRPSGILLDVGLPDLDGWTVMESLKADPATRDIPVHFITASDDAQRAHGLGAIGLTTKPVELAQVRSALHALDRAARAGVHRVLLVDPDAARRAAMAKVLAANHLVPECVGTVKEAMSRLALGPYGCVVAHADVEPADRAKLGDVGEIVVAEAAHSEQRVLDETRQFVHRVRADRPAREPRPDAPAASLAGKTVLVVDDDMRNVYSLSAALRAKDLTVLTATDGQDALDELDRHPETSLVLMDIMMPRMDGHEATAKIRGQARFRELPIIALTAKTMPGEREKCLAAGANDYVPKPVDVGRLVTLLRVWLA